MIVALEIAKVMANAGLGTLGVSVFVGRIPASKADANGIWSVASNGGQPEGGNVAKYRTRTQLQISHINNDATDLYASDDTLKAALSAIPYSDARFIAVTVGTMQDQDLAESERRIGVWNVEVVTFNDPAGS